MGETAEAVLGARVAELTPLKRSVNESAVRGGGKSVSFRASTGVANTTCRPRHRFTSTAPDCLCPIWDRPQGELKLAACASAQSNYSRLRNEEAEPDKPSHLRLTFLLARIARRDTTGRTL